MTRVIRLLCPLAASVLMAAAASAQTSDPAMDTLRTAYEQAWKKADAKALAALYTEDAVTVNAAGVVSRGRAAIEKGIGETLAGDAKGTTLSITPGALQVIAPDVAVGDGTYTLTGGTGTATGKGRYLNTVVKRGASWAIAASAAFVPMSPQTGTKPPAGKTQD
jgi:uncharacterized protein (TIGR02246 family)